MDDGVDRGTRLTIWKTHGAMAKRRATPKDLPDTVREAVERTVQATVGSAQLTRGRAQEAVDEVVRGAETGAGAVRERVRDAEKSAGSVRERVLGALDERRPATQDDVRDLQKALGKIADRLDAIEERLPKPPARSRRSPGRSKSAAASGSSTRGKASSGGKAAAGRKGAKAKTRTGAADSRSSAGRSR